MLFSENWLRTWIDPQVDTEELAHRLTMAGLEVDAIEPAAPAFDNVVVGEVKTVRPHPDADKLRVTEVFDGETTWQVVCGAPNVREGLKAPLARGGATLPNGMKIKKAKLRGEPSHGMLCGGDEIGLASVRDGLLELPDDAPVGKDLREWLDLDDAVIELGITPNRGDVLSIAGLAQECSALFEAKLEAPETRAPEASLDARRDATIEAADACPVYLTQVIEDIPARGDTDMLIAERLRRAGVSTVEPIVDLLNYVMLETGQPMHAFDGDRLDGDIRVRWAKAGETMVGLNEQELTLEDDCLVVADATNPIALAGIIGSQPSGVSGETRRIVLESAHFTPEAVAGRARRFGLTTDAAFRFERGVDPSLPRQAIDRAAQLITELLGGKAGPVVEAAGGRDLPAPAAIRLDMDWAERRLGLPVATERAADLLTRLGCAVTREADVLTVVPPTRRFDLAIPEDLLEELARLIGYDNFRAPITRMTPEIGLPAATDNTTTRIGDLLADRGYFEAITYSFVDRELDAVITPDSSPIELANPIASQMAVMRQSLWPGLLEAVAHNQKRQQPAIRLFETGHRFAGSTAGAARESGELAVVAAGHAAPEQWGQATRPVDFYDLKGDLEDLLEGLGLGEALAFRGCEHPALHPGQSAEVLIDGEAVGEIGALHPETLKTFDLKGPVFAARLSLAGIDARPLPQSAPLSKFPRIRRDLALVTPTTLGFSELAATIHAAGGDFLRDVEPFDRYVGEGVAEGHQSLAVKLVFQNDERTLTDDEITDTINHILENLRQHDVELRG
ncbi:phenylalanine--tRNA ligase subunit beta [Guyparkeria halophila]|uniref:Phenylalanine--tRNA ligase beta subunit n=1 Tax=Guyparkeria halophila TaxID=47960 RepID=A0ABZ0YYH5_9GAMM|nr:phenylalanine--tRNA ligase subunit beta [Guyparkeria halophila]WQH17220.1 phenylalanine--tRNA ligase subunit beta [Guyparkeria halophila]